jgi:hypothetical protein
MSVVNAEGGDFADTGDIRKLPTGDKEKRKKVAIVPQNSIINYTNRKLLI